MILKCTILSEKKKKPVSTGHTVQDSFYITLLLLFSLLSIVQACTPMDGGAWRAIVYGVSESGRAE